MVEVARRTDIGGAVHRVMAGLTAVANVPAMDIHRPNATADVDLIAAAPDLLEALVALSNVVTAGHLEHTHLCATILDPSDTRCGCDVGLLRKEAARAKALIAKARGGE